MRLLHTGDWHLGKRLYGTDRADEAEAVLAQLATLAEEEAVDAVVVSGDLLDRRVVHSAALGACLRALERLAEAAPVLAVAGNHDDPDLWAHLAPHLAASGIHVAGHVRPAAEAVVTVPKAAGPLHAALLPWPEPGRIALDAGATAGYARSRYADLVADVIDDYAAEAVARHRAEGGAAVFVGHLMVERARAGGGERELTMGMTYAVPPGALRAGLDYLAWGTSTAPRRSPASRRRGVTAAARWPWTSARTTTRRPPPSWRSGGIAPRLDRWRSRPPGPWCACAGPSRTWPPWPRSIRTPGSRARSSWTVRPWTWCAACATWFRRAADRGALPGRARRPLAAAGGRGDGARPRRALRRLAPPAGPPAGRRAGGGLRRGARGSDPAAAGDEG